MGLITFRRVMLVGLIVWVLVVWQVALAEKRTAEAREAACAVTIASYQDQVRFYLRDPTQPEWPSGWLVRDPLENQWDIDARGRVSDDRDVWGLPVLHEVP